MKRLVKAFMSRVYLWLLAPQYLKRDSHARHQEIIEEIELRVFGGRTVTDYERSAPSELHVLARRSLAQCLCQRKLLGSRGIQALRQLVYGVSLPGLLLVLWWRTWRDRNTAPLDSTAHDVFVFFLAERLKHSLDPSVVPGQAYFQRRARTRFGWRETRFAFQVLRACPRIALYPELMANILRWTGHYGYALQHFSPHTVIHFFESTASSSLMTAFLHQHEIAHINIQHGERWKTADAAFSAFDEIHVWGEYFRELFHWQKSQAEKIVVAGHPAHLNLCEQSRCENQPRPKRMLLIDPCIYGIDSFDYPALLRILGRLDSEWEIRIRRHPTDRRADLELLVALNRETRLKESGIQIMEERPEEVPIDEALSRTRVVVGVTSAAMIDAWIAGCKVIHFPSAATPLRLLDRYQGSPNVWDASNEDGMQHFIDSPADLGIEEWKRVNHVTRLISDLPQRQDVNHASLFRKYA